ncbi:MAG: restriction endonuclease [Scytonematopsis contorta HA4267-MV1]|jgi:hypothetical protein|nr:restriction endonuclease [Scytonematopsis contorta HA4267-MV1]
MVNYRKTFTELEKAGSKFWPTELSEKEAQLSAIPLLIETHETFINILSVNVSSIEEFFSTIESSNLPANLFLKHLVILSDFGGEMLRRVSNEFVNLFPQGKFNYYWLGEDKTYNFKNFDNINKKLVAKFSNEKLKIRDKDLSITIQKHASSATGNILSNSQKDIIALLLFGSAYSSGSEDENDVASILAKCEIGSYLGKPDELNKFLKQRYIYVSRVTAGATSNSLGQIAQKYVADFIKQNISQSSVKIKSGSRLPRVTHTDEATGRLTSFDIVVTNDTKYVAVEVSFQVTTNSVIERKSGQAKSRYEQVEYAGHKIAYVIDGAGNFERRSAITNICSYSHCTVAFSSSELSILCNFIQDFLNS